jgi:integrase
LVPAGVWEALKAVKGLRKGKDRRVRECKPIKPVPDGDVEAVLMTVTPEIAAMIRLQTLTAMRPDEVTAMRPCDIDTAGAIWTYTLGDRSQGGLGHKTDHLEDGGDKYVCLGPKAQEIIKPFLVGCPPTAFLFSPKRAAARRYPNGNGGLRPKPKYNDDTYCRAVKRACQRAGVPVWTPNRLRHNRATEIRTAFGLEHAQAVLDHRSIETTQIYAERQTHLKREVALKSG